MAPTPPARPAPPAAPKPQPQLNEVFVGFKIGNDGKDADTALTITLTFPNKIIFAQSSGTFGEFESHGSYGNYNIPIVGSTPFLYNQGCSLTISIDPVGHDTWNFDCDLWLMFPGGINRQYNFTGHTLNQNVRSNTFQIPPV
ncbi:hypothetical protein [Granulicella tundricola]|uniref:PLAT domain-containing protein n=1 Tax=Granulicella tundricola (strain ATCC BAA-1859 / DSM 23138 / MP5ACTX9) TaxID=1198114 RepID=E8WWU1_GRATM|nr:hypothetical protein [Granulicella tundricola]ADW67419.1 hypothetical protein AciX9_0347 [Granulicella tundricola MP5ACTX9]